MEEIKSEHLGGGIRNDVASELVSPTEAWASMNEDSTILLGASCKRKGYSKKTGTTLNGAIKLLAKMKAWEEKNLVVAGSKLYSFTPPDTFTEVYSKIEGGDYDYVEATIFMDDVYGGIFVFLDGVSQPFYWDGKQAPEELPVSCPIAKCGTNFKSYFILGNLTLPTTQVLDSEDITISSIPATNYSSIHEIDIGWHTGTILSICGENGEASPSYDIHIFSAPPKQWKTNLSVSQDPMYSTDAVANKYWDTAYRYIGNNLKIDFYTPTQKLYVGVYNKLAGVSGEIKLRIVFQKSHATAPYDIQWCPPGEIREWNATDESGNPTGGGRLSIYTREGGEIIKIIPISKDVTLVYKDDGSIHSLTTTGNSTLPFITRMIYEGLEITNGHVIFPYKQWHYVLSGEGFIKVSASQAEVVEPYGKAKSLFNTKNVWWKNCQGVIDEKESKIYITIPRTGVESKDGILIFDIRAGSYDVWDVSANVVGLMEAPLISLISELGDESIASFGDVTIDEFCDILAPAVVYSGSLEGEVYKLNSGLDDDGEAINGWRETGWLSHAGKSTMTLGKSGWLSEDSNAKLWFREIDLVIDLLDGDLTLEYKCDYAETWTTLPTISQTAGKESKLVRCFINKVGKVIKLRWSNSTINETYIVREFCILGEIVGRR